MNESKKRFEEAEIEIVVLETQDVITGSDNWDTGEY